MKKVLSFAFILLFLSLSSCNYDIYYGKRPFDYENAKWICEKPFIWFVIDQKEDKYYEPYGEINVNDQIMMCKFHFISQTNLLFITIEVTDTSYDIDYQNRELKGECEFSEEKMIVSIDKNEDSIFNGQYEKLVFTRVSEKQT